MNTPAILPTPSETLRFLVTASGYRPYFAKTGSEKDLDDQSGEKRQGSNFDLLEHCQTQWLRAIGNDAGADWSNLVESAWHRHANLLRSLARNADTRDLNADPARQAVFRLLIVPELSGSIRRASLEIPLMDVAQWCEAPFATWLHAATRQTRRPAQPLLEQLANHLDLDQRTLERWQHAEPIGKPLWPYHETVNAMFQGSELTRRQTECLTGWLAMTVAMQSLPKAVREHIKQDLNQQSQGALKNEQQFIAQLRREATDPSSPDSQPLRHQVAVVLGDLDRLLGAARTNERPIRDRLNWLQGHCERGGPSIRAAYQYNLFWLSATLAAHLDEKDKALQQYADACREAWWRTGPTQQALLREALCYAVGIGDKVQANHYWDRCFLLGLNKPPKRALDEREMRLISFEFEQLFAPQKAKQRIPPPIRFKVMDKPFSLSAKDLANPNRKCAEADGRVRYTPLMNAVMQGTTAQVKQAVLAGADPNFIMPESGENALIMALRRAYDRQDPDILQYLLTLSLSPATANHPASCKRETPLQLAMDMGDAAVVTRLIALGADIEQTCFTLPSALIYAMALLHGSIHVDDPAQLNAYLQGRVPADALDAKRGAILDCELPAQRLASMPTLAEPLKALLFAEATKYYSRPVEARRAVVLTLLDNKADPNRRYADTNGHRGLWTPTLFAAQIGDLDILKALIKAGGDPWLTLDDDSPLNEKNALWAAVAYKRLAVVEYLQAQLLQRSSR